MFGEHRTPQEIKQQLLEYYAKQQSEQPKVAESATAREETKPVVEGTSGGDEQKQVAEHKPAQNLEQEVEQPPVQKPKQEPVAKQENAENVAQYAKKAWDLFQYENGQISDVIEYVNDNIPKSETTQALYDAIDKYEQEDEDDRNLWGRRGDLEPYRDAILDELERLSKQVVEQQPQQPQQPVESQQPQQPKVAESATAREETIDTHKNWVVTSYDNNIPKSQKKSETSTLTTPESTTKAGLSPSTDLSNDKVTTNSANKQEESVKNAENTLSSEKKELNLPKENVASGTAVPIFANKSAEEIRFVEDFEPLVGKWMQFGNAQPFVIDSIDKSNHSYYIRIFDNGTIKKWNWRWSAIDVDSIKTLHFVDDPTIAGNETDRIDEQRTILNEIVQRALHEKSIVGTILSRDKEVQAGALNPLIDNVIAEMFEQHPEFAKSYFDDAQFGADFREKVLKEVQNKVAKRQKQTKKDVKDDAIANEKHLTERADLDNVLLKYATTPRQIELVKDSIDALNTMLKEFTIHSKRGVWERALKDKQALLEQLEAQQAKLNQLEAELKAADEAKAQQEAEAKKQSSSTPLDDFLKENLSEEEFKEAQDLIGDIQDFLNSKFTKQINGDELDSDTFRSASKLTILLLKGGLRKFSDFCKLMIGKFGDKIRGSLRSLYLSAKASAEAKSFRKELDTEDEVYDFDVENFDIAKYETEKPLQNEKRAVSLQSKDNFVQTEWWSTLLPEQINDLSGAEHKAKRLQWARDHASDIIEAYIKGNGHVLDPDKLRLAFIAIGYNGSNVNDYVEAEGYIRDLLYDRLVGDAVKAGNPTILFLTGNGGAGKSSAEKDLDLQKYGIVVDSSLNNYSSLDELIKRAAELGIAEKDMEVAVVYNDLYTSYTNGLRRGQGGKEGAGVLGKGWKGRSIRGLAAYLKAYSANNGKLNRLVEEHPDVVIVNLVDNRGNKIKNVTIDEALKWDYSIKQEELDKLINYIENEEYLKKRKFTILEGLERDGKRLLQTESGGEDNRGSARNLAGGDAEGNLSREDASGVSGRHRDVTQQGGAGLSAQTVGRRPVRPTGVSQTKVAIPETEDAAREWFEQHKGAKLVDKYGNTYFIKGYDPAVYRVELVVKSDKSDKSSKQLQPVERLARILNAREARLVQDDAETKQAVSETKKNRKKADKNAIQDDQPVLDLFSDAVDEANNTPQQEKDIEENLAPEGETTDFTEDDITNGRVRLKDGSVKDILVVSRAGSINEKPKLETIMFTDGTTAKFEDIVAINVESKLSDSDDTRRMDGGAQKTVRTISERPQRGNGGVGEEEQPQTVRPDTVGVDKDGGGHRGDDRVRSGSVPEPQHQPTVKKNLHNFHNERGNRFYATNSSVRVKDNVEAIRTLRELQQSGKTPTKEQQERLARFTGWGGLGSVITLADSQSWNSLQPLAKELKDTLLSEEEWQALINSSRTAFYTPVEVIDTLWDVVKQLGFKGGNILEGSAGIGNILAQMPTDISDVSALQAIEYDPTTAAILSYLYPDAQTHSAGFQDIDIKPNSIDLAITNVPFGKGNTFDKNNPDLDFGLLQDFCIAKNVRALKEGGIGVFISTSGTLENSSVRKWITQGDKNKGNADIIGAFRLNNATFGEATDVTSDIIIVRKRVNGEKSPQAIDVMSTGIGHEYKDAKGKVEARVAYNQYFIDHPEYMGGEMDFVSRRSSRGVDRYGKKDSTLSCFPIDETTQSLRLQSWVESFKAEQQATTTQVAIPQEDADLEDCTIPDALVGSMQIDSKGRVCQVTPAGKMKPLLRQDKVKGRTKATCVREYQNVLQALDALLAYQIEHETDEGLKPLFDKLNSALFVFKSHYGNLYKNISLAWLRKDARWADFAALEIAKRIDKPDGTAEIKFEKPSILTQRVIKTPPVFKPQNNKEGAILSIQQKGKLDLDFIAEQLGKPIEQVRREMIDEGVAFTDPITDDLVISYEYLSGNVRKKLKEAEAKNENGKYDRNIEELKKRQPIDIPFHLINITCGATYIPESVYVDFMAHKLGTDEQKKSKLKVKLVNNSIWVVENNDWDTIDKNNTLGVYSNKLRKQWTFTDIFIAALHDKTIEAKAQQTIEGQKITIFDEKAQEQLLQKIEDVKEEFVDWYKELMQSDSTVAGQLETIYNERYNNFAPLHVSDDFIPTKYEGQNPTIELRGYQKHAVAKAITRNTMIAHEVGTGKTFTMITTAMEMRRLGMAHKPMIVVQKATIGQFANEAKRLYPNAKILALNKDFDGAEGRKEFLKQIKYNDWDIVIITQPALDKIPDSAERQRAYISEKIQEIEEALELAAESNADDKVIESLENQLTDAAIELAAINIEIEEGGIGKKKTAGDLKKEAEREETATGRAKKKLSRSVDDVKDFDDLGIDALFVDEAHAYKKLGFSTLSSRDIRGVDSSASKRAVSLYLKTRAIYDKVGGYKNVIFATGTPITNTAAECWTYMRYLMPKEQLQELGIHLFDAFRKTFGEIVSQGEMKTSGEYKETKRFSKYNNVAELLQIWSQIADTVLQPEENKKNLPKTITASGTNEQAPNDVFLKMTPGAKAIIKWVYSQFDMYNNASKSEQYRMTKEGFHLKMFKIAKMAAIDVRLVSTDPNTPDEPGNKTNRTVEITLNALEQTKAYRGTVAIFCDKYRNTATGFNIFEEMKRKLIEAGVPENEIAIISGKELSDDKKTAIFDAVRDGRIRVIMGTTQRMGIGVNIQDRLHTLIHMDAPDMPMEYTQRNGRIIRQGNLHAEWGIPVDVVRLGVERSLDTSAFQRLKTKNGFIEPFMTQASILTSGKEIDPLQFRLLEEDSGIFDNPVAELSGSSFLQAKTDAVKQLRKLKNEKATFEQTQNYARNKLEGNNHLLNTYEHAQSRYTRQLELIKQNFGEKGITTIAYNGKSMPFSEQSVQKVLEPIRKEQTEINKDLASKSFGTVNSEYDIQINGNNVHILISKTRVFEGNNYVTHTTIAYKCRSLFGDETYHTGYNKEKMTALPHLIEDIQTQINVSQVEGWKNTAENNIQRLNQENDKYKKTLERTFDNSAEIEKVQKFLSEIEKKIEAEVEAARAELDDVQEVDGDTISADFESDAEAQFDELDYDADNLTEEQAFARDAVIEVLQHNAKKAGIEIEFDADERELDIQKKSSVDIATWSELMVRANKAADISTNDGAKILKNIESAKQKIENQSGKNIKNIIGVIAGAANLEQHSSSHYGTFKTRTGEILTLRISNHNATVSNFDNVGEQDGVSIVISNRPSNGITNDGNAHIIEYFYPNYAGGYGDL